MRRSAPLDELRLGRRPGEGPIDGLFAVGVVDTYARLRAPSAPILGRRGSDAASAERGGSAASCAAAA